MRRVNDVGDIFEIELSYDKAIETINIVDNINIQVKDELINGSKLNLLLHSNSNISKLNVIATLEDETNIPNRFLHIENKIKFCSFRK